MDQYVTVESVLALKHELAVGALELLHVLGLMSDSMVAQVSLCLECFTADLTYKLAISRVDGVVIVQLTPALESLGTLWTSVFVASVKVSLDVLLKDLLRTVDLTAMWAHERFIVLKELTFL